MCMCDSVCENVSASVYECMHCGSVSEYVNA